MSLIIMSIESDFVPQIHLINKYRCEFPEKGPFFNNSANFLFSLFLYLNNL
jgi:hypothetical protein